MRSREAAALARMLARPPRIAPRWVTPEMVVEATAMDGLDIIARSEMRTIRIMLLAAVARRAVADLALHATEGDRDAPAS